MKQNLVVLGTLLLNATLMAMEWDHISGNYEEKGEIPSHLTISYVENVRYDTLERLHMQKNDIVVLGELNDAIYDELKDDYAHFYFRPGALGMTCIASKVAINPFLSFKNTGRDSRFKDGLAFDVIVAMARADKSDDNQTRSKNSLEFNAGGDTDRNAKLEVDLSHSKKNEESSTTVSGTLSVTVDDEGNTKGEWKTSVRIDF